MQVSRPQSWVLFTLYDSWNMCFLLKYGSWKLHLKSWNTNYKSLNQILNDELVRCFCPLADPWKSLTLISLRAKSEPKSNLNLESNKWRFEVIKTTPRCHIWHLNRHLTTILKSIFFYSFITLIRERKNQLNLRS